MENSDKAEIKSIIGQIMEESIKPQKKQKKQMEFSKKLSIAITILFSITLIAGWVTWFYKGSLPNEMLDYITVPFLTVMGGYFTKSGVENYTKIKNNNGEDK